MKSLILLCTLLVCTTGQQLRSPTESNGTRSGPQDQQVMQLTEEFVQALESLDANELSQYFDEHSQINFAGMLYEGKNSLQEFGRIFTKAADITEQQNDIINADEVMGIAIINSTVNGTFVTSKKPFSLNKLLIIKWTTDEKIDTCDIILKNPHETLTAYMTTAVLCMEQTLGPRLESDNPLNLTEDDPIREFLAGENLTFTVVMANDTDVLLKLMDGQYPVQIEHHVYGENCTLKSIDATFVPILHPNYYPIFRNMTSGNTTSGNTTSGNTTETGGDQQREERGTGEGEGEGDDESDTDDEEGNDSGVGAGIMRLAPRVPRFASSPLCQMCARQHPECLTSNANCPMACRGCI